MYCCRFRAKAAWVMVAARLLRRYRDLYLSRASVPVRRAEAAVIISQVPHTWRLQKVWTATLNRPAVKVSTGLRCAEISNWISIFLIDTQAKKTLVTLYFDFHIIVTDLLKFVHGNNKSCNKVFCLVCITLTDDYK